MIKSLTLYLKSPEDNFDSKAFFKMGNFYMYGSIQNGIEKNYENALKYYQKSYDLGNAHARAMLGKIYMFGLANQEQNTTKGIEFLGDAIAKGSIDAMATLGYAYQNGIGVEVNDRKAFFYIKMAADQKHLESINNLGMLYLTGKGTLIDTELGLKYLTIAAMNNYFKGKLHIANLLFLGELLPKSYEMAFSLSIDVISEGIGSKYMANAYKSFRENDFEGAYIYFLTSAALGNVNAIQSLIYLIENSLINISPISSIENYLGFYLLKSISINNDEWSYEKMAKILYNGGKNFSANFTQAYEYYMKVNSSGEALYLLAHMTEEGLGCEKDLSKALSMYESIIIRANNGNIDRKALYPAILSKFRINLKIFINKILTDFL